MEKYQPSPQWINLFVFVKDPENKVRQAFTPCSPPKATGQSIALSNPSLLTEGLVSSQAGSSRRAMLFAICILSWQCWHLRLYGQTHAISLILTPLHLGYSQNSPRSRYMANFSVLTGGCFL